jgi:hypothetical protein
MTIPLFTTAGWRASVSHSNRRTEMEKAMNWVKDAYTFCIDGIEAHPHMTLWAGVSLVAIFMVL